MITEQTKGIVWQTYLDIARYVRYYPALATRWRRRSWALRGVLGLSATGAVASLLGGLPIEVGFAASAAIAVLAVLDLVVDVGRRSVMLDTIVTDIDHIETDCQRLWENVQGDQLSEEDARREHGDLSQRIDRVMSRLIIDIDTKLNQRCTEEAYITAQARYMA